MMSDGDTEDGALVAELAECEFLTDWETEFYWGVDALVDDGRDLTPKQRKTARKIIRDRKS